MNPLVRAGRALLAWFDTGRASAFEGAAEQAGADRIDWLRTLPFILMHVACLFVFAVGVSPIALIVCAALYFIRMFAITGFYHRYFSHQSFKTSRVGQFVFAVLGASAVQRGPDLVGRASSPSSRALGPEARRALAGAARLPAEPHGLVPVATGFAPDLQARARPAALSRAALLDRFDILVPVRSPWACSCSAWRWRSWAPGLGTNGWQMLVWGFFVSTVLCYHAHLHDQLAVARVRQAPLRDRRRQPQQLVGSRCSRSARAGTTTTITTRARRARASTGGKST